MEITPHTEKQLRQVFKAFNRFMILLWRLGLGSYGNGTRLGGSIMVIAHTGRKTGLRRLTPVNYTVYGGDIFCTAGFGRESDWYRNIQANPLVELWLPNGRWRGEAEDVSDTAEAPQIMRQVLVASGFAGPLFGVNPKHLSEVDLQRLLDSYRLVRIKRTEALTGSGGPGDLAWVWPTATMVLLPMVLFKRCRRK